MTTATASTTPSLLPSGPASPTHTRLDIAQAPINPSPAELDSTPVSPVSGRDGAAASIATATDDAVVGAADGRPDFHGEGFEELNGNCGRERRAQLLEERKRDPAVLVDIPDLPTAVELKWAEGEGKGRGAGGEGREAGQGEEVESEEKEEKAKE